MQFEFASATRIVFGAGRLGELPSLVHGLGDACLLVTGREVQRAGRALELLKGAGLEVVTFCVSGEPEISTIERGVEAAKSCRCGFVVGMGGGSVMDAAKAVAAMMTNDGALLDCVEIIGWGRALERAGAPFIAIPTTAGTGSEVTRNSVLTSPEHRVKVSLRSPLMLARVALVDPELTYSLPPELTASTGLDALTQLIEPYVCTRANPMTDGLCVEGIRRAARSLRAVFLDGGNNAAREDMAVASLFGGIALANAGLGAVHGFAGPIGGMFNAPHGAVCATLLPHVMEANVRGGGNRETKSAEIRGVSRAETLGRYDEVGRLLTGRADADALDGVEWVRQLVKDLRIPPLRSYGITQGDIPGIVEKSLQASSMKSNPVLLGAEELTVVCRAAL